MEVYIADWNSEIGCRGFGEGLEAAQRSFLREPKPALVLGLECRESSAERGFGALLALPCVRYLELPFTTDELADAAKSIRGLSANEAALTAIRSGTTRSALERLNRNVTHVLEGGIVGTLKNTQAAVRDSLNPPCLTEESRIELQDFAASIEFFRTRLDASLLALAREIKALDGIAPPEILRVLDKQHEQLKQGLVPLKRVADTIVACVRDESSVGAALESVIADVDAFSRIRAGVATALRGLPCKVAAREKKRAGVSW